MKVNFGRGVGLNTPQQLFHSWRHWGTAIAFRSRRGTASESQKEAKAQKCATHSKAESVRRQLLRTARLDFANGNRAAIPLNWSGGCEILLWSLAQRRIADVQRRPSGWLECRQWVSWHSRGPINSRSSRQIHPLSSAQSSERYT